MVALTGALFLTEAASIAVVIATALVAYVLVVLVTFPVVLVSHLSATASTATIGLVKEAKK